MISKCCQQGIFSSVDRTRMDFLSDATLGIYRYMLHVMEGKTLRGMLWSYRHVSAQCAYASVSQIETQMWLHSLPLQLSCAVAGSEVVQSVMLASRCILRVCLPVKTCKLISSLWRSLRLAEYIKINNIIH